MGKLGSSGTYAPPALAMPSTATTRSERALQGHTHALAGPDAQGAQVVRELVGARVELRGGERLALEAHGHRVRGRAACASKTRDTGWPCGYVRGRSFHAASVVRSSGVSSGSVPMRCSGLSTTARSSDSKWANRRSTDARSSTSVLCSTVTVSPPCHGKTTTSRSHFGGPVRLRVQQAQLQAGQLERRQRRVLQHELHVEELPTRLARRLERLHQRAEGQVLVLVGVQGPLAHAVQQRAEGQVARHLRAQDELVGEEADQRLQLLAGAVRDVRAHDDVVLAGAAVQERVERGEQHHEQRGALPSAQRLDAGREVGDRWKRRLSPWKRSPAGRGASVRSAMRGAPASCFFHQAICCSSTSPLSHWRCQRV